MNRRNLNRREFLQGCCATAAAGASGPLLMFSPDADARQNAYDTVVQVFLRGAMDGLNLVLPVSGNDRGFYEEARPNLKIAATGAYSALPLTLAGGAASGFGLHPSATGLGDIWSDGKLAIVQACGLLTSPTRSHFDAQLYLDTGTPGRHGTGTGWLTRAAYAAPASSPMPELAVNSRQPNNFLGSIDALTMGSPSDFALNAGAYAWQTYRSGMPAGTRGVNESIAGMWNGSAAIETTGHSANASLQLVATQPYAALPAGWPTSTFARQLWTVAQSIRFNLGLRYAAVDLGGWDTHEGQGTAGSGYSYYQNKIAELSQALTAFYVELAAGGELPRVTVVVQSEFGRRVRQNGSGGTDHGYGNPMLVMGGPVNGRKLYGDWKGLDPEVLSPYFGDVPVTTDFRRVLSELLIRRMRNNQLGTVFPGYTGYSPLGVFTGSDIAPQYVAANLALPAAQAAFVTSPAVHSEPEIALPSWRARGRSERMLVRRGL